MGSSSLFVKLLAAFGSIAGVLMLLSMYSIVQVATIGGYFDTAYEEAVLPLEHWAQFKLNVGDIRNLLYNHISEEDDEKVLTIETAIERVILRTSKFLRGQGVDTGSKSAGRFGKGARLRNGKLSATSRDELLAALQFHWTRVTTMSDLVIFQSSNFMKEEAAGNLGAGGGRETFNSLEGIATELLDRAEHQVADYRDRSLDLRRRVQYYLAVGCVLAVMLSLGIGTVLARRIVRPLSESMDVIDSMAAGDLSRRVRIDSHDEVGRMAEALNRAAEGMQRARDAELVEKERATRLHAALEGSTNAFLMIDRSFTVTYVNRAMLELLGFHEDSLRALYPSFSAARIVGSCVDQFHEDPGRLHLFLENPGNLPFSSTIQIGPLHFAINVTAIHDLDRRYVGNTLEWADVTDRVDAQTQVSRLIQKAVEGQLNDRIETESYSGFMRELGSSINSMLDAVVNPIQALNEVVSALAGGDFTRTMDGDSFQGQFSMLQESMNSSMAQLALMVREIRDGAANITTGASEIAAGTGLLSQRIEGMRNSLDLTTANLGQLTSTIRQNSDHASRAAELSKVARNEAAKGGDVIGRTISAMGEINESSRKIADIIGVIDEIAFQTNLLALNAAVEAARAGEQGRGFAVVASEVRNLAGRSAAAAREIKELINDSVEKVVEGTKLVDESGETLEGIVKSVKTVSEIVAEIAGASQDQALGIERIDQAVRQMNDATQSNAAAVEETAASAVSMDSQAKALSKRMGNFKVDRQSS